MNLERDGKCFACGQDNPIGLKLKFDISEDKRRVRTECLPDEKFQGWSNILHGGIVATILDEAINRLGIINGGNVSLTASLSVRYRNPVPLGEKLYVEAEATKIRGRYVEGRAEMRLSDGTLVADAIGKCISLSPER